MLIFDVRENVKTVLAKSKKCAYLCIIEFVKTLFLINQIKNHADYHYYDIDSMGHHYCACGLQSIDPNTKRTVHSTNSRGRFTWFLKHLFKTSKFDVRENVKTVLGFF